MEKSYVSGTEQIMSTVLNVAAYISSPLLFIWAVNTLFTCAIPYTFKTWLAGFVLIILVRFHVKPFSSSYEYDDYYPEEFDDEDEAELTPEERRARMKANIIDCHDHNNKNDPPPSDLNP